MKTLNLKLKESNMLDESATTALLQSDIDYYLYLIRELKQGIQEIYTNRGEDEFIANICNPLLKKQENFNMQEFKHKITGKEKYAFSEEQTMEIHQKKMDEFQSKILGNGFKENKMVIVGRNDKCPCGSMRKFKKCCINKVNRTDDE